MIRKNSVQFYEWYLTILGLNIWNQVRWHELSDIRTTWSRQILSIFRFDYSGTLHSLENSLISLSRNHNAQNVKDNCLTSLSRRNETLSSPDFDWINSSLWSFFSSGLWTTTILDFIETLIRPVKSDIV